MSVLAIVSNEILDEEVRSHEQWLEEEKYELVNKFIE